MTDTVADPSAEALLDSLITAALKAGADAAEAALAHRASLSVGVRQGRLEEVEREESRDLGLRVFIGRRKASVSASDLSRETQERLVERVVAMARLAPEDPYAGLAEPDQLAPAARPELDLFDPAEPDAAELEARALAVEAAALDVSGVARSEGGHASHSTGSWSLMTSAGFSGTHRASLHSAAVGVIAERDGAMERGGEGRTTRWLSDLPDLADMGRDAGRRAVAQLGARKLDSMTAPLIVENRIASGFLSPLIGAITGPAVARGTSFLRDRLGEAVLSADCTLVDDPFRPRGLGSAPFDDEGVAVARRSLVEAGRLTTWLLNLASARQLGLASTGHASRGLVGPAGVSPHNLTLEPGTLDLAGLMRTAGRGLFVTAMFGPSLNANTGDWSTGVSGFWFEDGEIAYPVNEVTVAGNLIDLYQRVLPGSDLEIRGSHNAPSLLVDAVAIAGR